MKTFDKNLKLVDEIELVQPADFAVAHLKGMVGRGITYAQRLSGSPGYASVMDHAFIATGRGTVIEAMPGGAIESPLSKYADYELVWSTDLFPLSGEQRTIIVAKAYRLLKTPYSDLDYLALAAHRFHIPAPGLRGFIADQGHMICSQLVDACYQAGDFQLFSDGRWNGYVAPADLDILLLKEGIRSLGRTTALIREKHE